MAVSISYTLIKLFPNTYVRMIPTIAIKTECHRLEH